MVKRLKTGFGVRTAFGVGLFIAVAFTVWMVALHLTSPADVANILVVRGVGWVCAVAGTFAALGLACDLEERDVEDGIAALVRQRGFSSDHLAQARWYATVRLVAGSIFVPSVILLVVGVALSRSVDVLLGRLLLGLGIVAFIGLTSGVLALTARGVVALERRHARWVLAAILIGPELLRTTGLEMVSIASVLGAVLQQVGRLQGVVW